LVAAEAATATARSHAYWAVVDERGKDKFAAAKMELHQKKARSRGI
jgi:hypothetical protein